MAVILAILNANITGGWNNEDEQNVISYRNLAELHKT